jgi:WD40 repeat protein
VRREEDSGYFFEKKVTKKILLTAGCDFAVATARRFQKFFCFFFYKKRSAFLLLLVPGLAFANITPDSGPPQAPILRIDAGGATGAVARVSVDAAGTLMAAAGYDKVVRLYSLPDDVLRGTLRPPIGPAEEGELYAVAMSPDGATVFAAGATGGSWDRSFCIYLFSVAGQKLLARLPGLESPVNDLAVSADGTRLAAGLAKGGLLVWDARSGRQVFSDAAYAGPVRNLRFDGADRLFVAAADGFVRGYSAAGARFAKVEPRAGETPWGLAVSPDSGFVAVTYEGAPEVDVLSAKDLKAFFAPDVSGLSGGLLAVDWVVEGNGVSLLAGGYAREQGKNVIRRWGDFGLGVPADAAASGDTIRDIRAVPGGGAVYATEDPGWGRIGANGAVALAPAPAVADLRESRRALAVSGDGMAVIFNAGGALLKFDAGARSLGPVGNIEAGFAPPVTDGPDVENWLDTDAPSLGGKRLALDPEEYSRSLTVLPGGRFLLGTDTHLRLFDSGGNLVGSVPVDAAAWGVTASADGKIAVAALLDGTLRWFGVGDDGTLTPRATLFAAADGKRWVLFTPDGFFDEGDLGGQNLVGFHVNLGENQQPQWVSFGEGFRLFYAPAVVKAALGGDTGPEAAASASIGDLHERLVHEPTISVQGACVASGGDCRSITVSSAADVLLPDDAAALTLNIATSDRGLGVGAEDVFVNGRNVGREAAPALVNGKGVAQVTVPLDPGPDEIVVRQYDGGNAVYAESPPLAITRTDVGSAAAPAQGTLYVLAVGIDHFAVNDPSLTLKFAVSDATSFASLVGKAAAPDYAHVQVNLLTEGQATRAGILGALADVAAKAQPGDTFLFYVASHGGVNSSDGQFLIVPEDISDLSSWGTIEKGSVTESALVKALAAIRARDTLLFIDTCYAGAVSAANLANMGQESGRYIISASSSAQEALDSYDGKDGVLIYALRQAVSGDAPHDSHGVIGALSLGEYLSERVGALARQRGHTQDAAFTAAQSQLNSFPVASVTGGN